MKKKIDHILNKTSLNVIACIGETLEERESGQTNVILEKQLQTYQGKKKPKGVDVDESFQNRFKRTDAIGKDQYERVVIAYEPIWAIGTGRVATPEQAEEVHRHLRKFIEKSTKTTTAQKIRIIYGGQTTTTKSLMRFFNRILSLSGSVSASNCQTLARQPNIDGFLVGGEYR